VFFLKDLPTRQMVEGYALSHGVDPSTIEDALSMMRRASLLIRKLETYFSGHDLSQLRFLIMIVIDREPNRDSLTIGEITERLDVKGPVITRTIKVLVDDGLVAIGRDEDDQRTRHASLTPAGKAKLADVIPGYLQLIEFEMAAGLGEGA
jgi:DNA-binding MarR family transcriptional regulator